LALAVAPIQTNKKYEGLARIIGCVPLLSGLADFVFVLLKGRHISQINKNELWASRARGVQKFRFFKNKEMRKWRQMKK
jgi:hypothetical protein